MILQVPHFKNSISYPGKEHKLITKKTPKTYVKIDSEDHLANTKVTNNNFLKSLVKIY